MTPVGGRYALLERIGSGAMGVVWRARDEVLGREVAVKQLVTPDHHRAMREARNAARLHHPHAIAVFDVLAHDDASWLVMEYLPSRSLSAVIAEDGPVSPEEAARIGGHVASALAAAHDAGIVHRDIKPGNVLIGHDGTVKITDFGISRATGDGTMTDTGTIAGTPAFLAPEIARGEQPDTASDVFSLGATLFAAVEGTGPFGQSDNPFGLIYRAASGQLLQPVKAGPLTETLMRLLSVERSARPTASEAAELLAPDQISQPLPVPSARKPRKKLVLVLGVVALLAFSGTAAAVFWPESSPPVHNSGAGFPDQPRYYTPSEADQFVVEHYKLLPDEPGKAWENLSRQSREPVDAYTARWENYTDVKCTSTGNVRGHGPNWVVTVALELISPKGTEAGTYDVEVASVDNQMKIVNSTKVG
ncbi:serine/threonine protein kinase [Lentzea sp. NBRC 105346]|uniref:serine/threonine-protein kinase n=1 Tax=Lentzea sp. NBRC 105346 TaxID=3032205 RepID=UPI0025529644|nr:serine/threonine-protein kinase [Lentzea sp. NBRC 105346]GLZ30425.1 serine/threonine protein kinase [Lentzea sp. NBRC 105346]